MSLDFTALAGSLAVGVPGVRVCLFVSGDGLALAAHPASEEAAALVAWARLNELGLMERGFVSMENENWIFSKGPEYSGLVITDPAVRPGILLDRLDQALELAAESRARQEGMSPVPGVLPPMGAAAKETSRPARKIRLPVHREAPRAAPTPELVEAERVPSRTSARPPSAPPMPPEPPAGSVPSRPGREDAVQAPEDRAAAPPMRQSRPADEAKPTRRRGLGNYVGKQSKGARPLPRRREAEEERLEEIEAPRRKQRVQPPSPRRDLGDPRDAIEAEEPATPVAVEEPPVEVREPELRPDPVAVAPEPEPEPEPEPVAEAPEPEPEPVAEAPEPEPEPVAQDHEPEPDSEPAHRRPRSRRLDADLETILAGKAAEAPAEKVSQPQASQQGVLEAVSAALEAPGRAAAPEAEIAPVAEAPEPRVAEEPGGQQPDDAPAGVDGDADAQPVAEAEALPEAEIQPEPAEVLLPEPEPAGEIEGEPVAEPVPEPEAATETVAETADLDATAEPVVVNGSEEPPREPVADAAPSEEAPAVADVSVPAPVQPPIPAPPEQVLAPEIIPAAPDTAAADVAAEAEPAATAQSEAPAEASTEAVPEAPAAEDGPSAGQAELTEADRAAARWRGRMKSKAPAKAEPKEGSGAEAPADVQSAPQDAEDIPQAAPSANGSGSDGDVDVVALAREFSSLFGDDGGEG